MGFWMRELAEQDHLLRSQLINKVRGGFAAPKSGSLASFLIFCGKITSEGRSAVLSHPNIVDTGDATNSDLTKY